MHPDWIEHRRGADGELLGWMEPAEGGFVVIDLLGRPRSDALDWLAAEETLDALGIGYLGEPHELRLDTGEWIRVRITEASPRGIRVKQDDWGAQAVGSPQVFFTVEFPAPAHLRPIMRGTAR
ncbi:hypothetical protein BCL57_000093 [Agromyces flavus]|uniref:Uncharacterized protein n=1 Tax=Agromyces flavus TaxID=589382 RepID=A0A1H1VKA7_9MICO|nr:hypothetical protein [Agromyces flavus]MCP2365951.1 hypothetical protein [Agromyces flavus]GGI43705.1 hypothetical protein GCM10010932_00930 [Agromyces flavus]SDS84950.1 hypothetical protein SAMN04489721_2025 [Agromyces flavus]